MGCKVHLGRTLYITTTTIFCFVCLIIFKYKISLFIVTLSKQDEPSTLQLLKKHLVLEQTIEDYAETIGLLSQQCRQLLEMGHPDW